MALEPWDTLVVVGAGSGPDLAARGLLRGQAAVEQLDADNECRHGRLPTDRSAPCGCWPQEIVRELDTVSWPPVSPDSVSAFGQLVLL